MPLGFERGFGAIVPPLSDTNATTLASLDPARDSLLAVLLAAINAELTVRWTDAVAGTSLAGTLPVQDVLPDEPTEALIEQRSTAFPLLCVYRTPEEITVLPWTMGRDKYQSTWMVEWILGPCNVIERRRFRDALQYVAKMIAVALREGGHPSYATQAGVNPDGTTSGVSFTQRVLRLWFDELSVSAVSMTPVPFSEGGTPYETLRVKLNSIEVENWREGMSMAPYGGMTLSQAIVTDEGTLQDAVRGDTDWIA